jgi:2-oxoglutarate ferredoxin oxidoreductase subunit alpha
MATRAAGHGDGHVIVFAPSTVQEMADLVALAFDLGDHYRVPVMVLADGLLGQMMEPVELPEPLAKEDLPAKPWAIDGHGNARPHNAVNSLFLVAQELEDSITNRWIRYEQIKAEEQRAEHYLTEDADFVIVAYGAASRIARSAINKARAQGIRAGLIRPITLWPYPKDSIEETIERTKAYLVTEFSMGQMVDDVRLVVNGRRPVNFFAHTGGIVPTPDEVVEALRRVAAGEDVDTVPVHSRLTGESR